MTGNTKIWRAPLAGLASVAMIATMGMAAATANAASDVESTTFVPAKTAATYTLTVNANGGKFSDAAGYKSSVEAAIQGDGDKVTFNSTDTVATITNVPANVSSSVAQEIFPSSTAAVAYDGRETSGFYTAQSLGSGSRLDNSKGFTLSGDTTVYAHWYVTREKVTVTFGNQGNAVLAPGDTLTDWQIPAVTDNTRAGDYWQTADGTQVTTSTVFEKTATLTPHLLDSITVKYEKTTADKTASVSPSTQIVVAGKAFAPAATATLSDNVFVGWYQAKNGGSIADNDDALASEPFDFDKGSTTDVTLFAKFDTAPADTTYDVTYKLAKDGAVYGTDTVYNNGKSTLNLPPAPTDPTNQGREFKNWKNDSGDADYDFDKVVTGDLTLYAVWGEPTVIAEKKATFDPNYSGSNIIEVTSNADGTFTAPSVERDGYVLSGWVKDNASGTTPDFDADKTDYAGGSKFYAVWVREGVDAFTAAKIKITDTSYFTADSVAAYNKAFDEAATKYTAVDKDSTAAKIAEATKAYQAAQALLVVKTSETAPVYRVYNKADNKHLYTSNHAEALSLIAGGWRDEGVAYYTLDANLDGTTLVTSSLYTPVYRLYDKPANRHFYTKDKSEKDNLVKSGWRYEGIAYYARTQGGVAVYRAYSPSRYEHLFTTSETEYETATTATGEGWYRAEGIAFYTEK